ncbi:MAG: ABC transporter ATP-binding protein [Oscillospiraceae bacterium]
MEQILHVENLTTSFDTKAGEIQAVRGISFDVNRGEILGIVGESGSGKSVTSLSILGVLEENAHVKDGLIEYAGQNLADLGHQEFRKIRGAKISMIFQDPMTSLNPLMKVGKQIAETLLEHNPGMGKEAAKKRAIELLQKVHIPEAVSRYHAYPHELSGGMRQRVMIAIAISCNPELLIADEPTTALDVTIQDQIIMLLKEMKAEYNLSVMFITHDLGVVAGICDRVLVLYGGLVMEEGTVDEIFYRTAHPYTLGLLESVPRLDQKKSQRLKPIAGSPPDMLQPPVGCPFYARCRWGRQLCIDERPEFTNLSDTHRSACWLLDPDAPLEDNPFGGLHEKS